MIRNPLAVLADVLDRLGRYVSAATIAGFALSPLTQTAYPMITSTISHLLHVVGDQTYDAFAEKGATMTVAGIVAYASGQMRCQSRVEHTLRIDGTRGHQAFRASA